MKPTFILGVGAQKAGTTWLHKALAAQSEVDMGFAKEYHVWDARCQEVCKSFRLSPVKTESGGQALRRLMQHDESIYCEYFHSLIRDNVAFTGDITPSYCCLSSAHFRHIKNLLEQIGFQVKVLFVMRDPVDRLWSAVRMALPKAHSFSVEDFRTLATERLYKSITSPASLVRSDYVSTIRNIDDAFDPEDTCYLFYENLFTNESMSKIEHCLGVSLQGVDFNELANSSVSLGLPVIDYENVRKAMAAQYQGCLTRFPEARDLWLR